MKAIITIGVSGSGKTTWAESQSRFHVISRDNIRFGLLENEDKLSEDDNMWSKWSFKRENAVTAIYWKMVEGARRRGQNIILADTNLNPSRRQDMRSRLEGLGYEVEFRQFDVDYETAVKRDLWRRDSVGAAIIWKQYKELYGEVYVPPSEAPKAVIVDIDGTLAHMSGRGPFEWHRVGEDSCDSVVKSIVNRFDANTYVIVLSGRDSFCRCETISWLHHNGIVFDELYMRAEGDMRKDAIVKRELFDKHIRDKYNIVAVFDDRPQMIRLWNLMGLKTFACADPYLEF